MCHVTAIAGELPALEAAPYVVHVLHIHLGEGVEGASIRRAFLVFEGDSRRTTLVDHSQLLAGAVKPGTQSAWTTRCRM
jgi:hypothetical protein